LVITLQVRRSGLLWVFSELLALFVLLLFSAACGHPSELLALFVLLLFSAACGHPEGLASGYPCKADANGGK